ncbi:MAG: hypothetical protein V1870_03065 [Candidatus Aenigmatarchaeota archaeon]
MTQTTISINREIREELKMFGRKGETYDNILSDLIELAKQHNFYQRQLHILKNERFVPLENI